MEINYTTVIAIVLGLAQWIKTRLKLEDRLAEISSAVVGLLIGGAYQYTVTNPVDFNTWFTVVLVGLATALVPSGIYKLFTSFIKQFAENLKDDTK